MHERSQLRSSRWRRSPIPEIEHIVVDGASTDGTADVVRALGIRVAHLVSGPDRGIYDAFDKGLRLASGDIVAYLNAGDTYASRDSVSPCVPKQWSYRELSAPDRTVAGKDTRGAPAWRMSSGAIVTVLQSWCDANTGRSPGNVGSLPILEHDELIANVAGLGETIVFTFETGRFDTRASRRWPREDARRHRFRDEGAATEARKR